MDRMDVVVHASDNEPFGLVVIEAMLRGRPVVAGAEGGPSEIVTPEVDGLLVGYGDAAGLATAVCRYLGDEALARRLGEQARRRAGEFTPERFAETVGAAVREVA
jgi:glycosyltransferase involved in cell wall biosynthesis